MKDIKYIFKRIIIGVGIALALMFIRGTLLIGVNAKEVYSYNWGSHQFTPVLTSSSTDFTLTSDSSLSNIGNGEILFSFSLFNNNVNKVPIVNQVRVYSGSSSFICNFGTVNNASGGNFNTTTGETFTGSSAVSYSVVCPVNLGSDGLTRVAIFYLPWVGTNDIFTLTFSNYFSFVKDNDSTQEIIENDNDNTQNIINNQNDNTQQQIESQKVCSSDFVTINNCISDGYLTVNGNVSVSSNYCVSDYILFDEISLNQSASSGTASICYYDGTKNLISCNTLSSILNIPSNAKYFRSSFQKSTNRPNYSVYVCKNGNQSIVDSQQQINDSLTSTDGVNDSDINDLFSDFESSDTPISDLLTMPITLANAYISGMSGSCQSISLGRLYGSNLIIPCINVESFLGSELWTVIDILCSLFLIYSLSQLFISAFDGITSLRDDFSMLYGIEGKHVWSPHTRVERNSDLY